MKKISCIAIDDEPIALLVIDAFCTRRGNMELKTFTEPDIGMQAIARHRPDIVFLDIEMNGISGLEIARSLPKGCCLILTTAHARYALDGFDLDAVDFLHKPFAYERFNLAVDKAIRRLEQLHHPQPGAETAGTIVVKQEYNSVTIPLNDILYVEALENYVKIFRSSGSFVLSRMNIKSMLEMLPSDHFIRTHRSYIVSADKVERFSKQEVYLLGISPPIPVGRRYANEAYEFLQKKGQQ